MTESKNINKRFAGLDLAKESIFACVVDYNGLREETKFLTTLPELIKLKKWLHSYQVEQVVMENTGIYTDPVVAVLRGDFQVEVVNAADTKRTNKKKTDQDDAWWLAELLKAGTIGKTKRITSSVLLSPKHQILRKLTRMKSKYVDQATRQKNRIHKVFDRLNIKIASIFGANKFTLTALQLYAALVQGLSWDELQQQLQEEHKQLTGIERGRVTRFLHFLQNNESAIQNALSNSVESEIPRIDRLELLLAITQLELLQKSIDHLTQEIEKFVQENLEFKEQLDILMTIPGLGETTSVQILAEIPSIDSFPSAEKFASFSGLVPRVSQSAEVIHLGHITKRGSPYLRKALFQAAKVGAMKKKSAIGQKFHRLYKRKGEGKGKIVWVAIARHLAVLIWTLLTRKEVYHEKNFVKKRWKKKQKTINLLTLSELLSEFRRRKIDITLHT